MNNIEISNLSKSEWEKIRKNYYAESKNHDPNLRKDLLFEIQDVMDSIPVRFWLTNGTALGFYRDKDFIPWDDDIDLDMLGTELNENFDLLIDKFLNLDYIVRATRRGEISKMSIFKHKEKISIGGFEQSGNYFCSKFYKFPKSFFENFEMISYAGREFRVPGPIEDYLTYLYTEWKIPTEIEDDNVMYNVGSIRR